MSSIPSTPTESCDQAASPKIPVVGVSREICKLCYHVNPVGFRVPDEIRNAVVPPHVRGQVVCLSCFTRLADEKCIAWDRQIEFFPVSLATHLSG